MERDFQQSRAAPSTAATDPSPADTVDDLSVEAESAAVMQTTAHDDAQPAADDEGASSPPAVPPLPDIICRAIGGLERADVVVRHLAQHADVAIGLSRMDPNSALTALFRIQRSLPGKAKPKAAAPDELSAMLAAHRGRITQKESNQRDREAAGQRALEAKRNRSF
jgi:hypothetical protein